VEDLLTWYHTVPQAWHLVLEIVQSAFKNGVIPAAFVQGILVLIPKSTPGQFRGIVLLDVLYKLCSTVIHVRLQNAIAFHSDLHGFRQHRGTTTAILEAKLLMQLAVRTLSPLFQIFLDLTKAYDSVDRTRTMQILAGYGVGPSLRRLIQVVWDREILVPKSAGYFGAPFHADRGVRQGDVISPIIFNIIVDCVIREWHRFMGESSAFIKFYADDGNLAGVTPSTVQFGLNLLVHLFARIGLQVNVDKTKSMISLGPQPYLQLSTAAYKRRFNHSLPSHRQRKALKVVCEHCGRSMSVAYLPIHRRDKHDIPIPTPVRQQAVSSVTYEVSFPSGVPTATCPVSGCPAVLHSRFGMREHFYWRHEPHHVLILEEGPLPQCPNCGRFLHSVDDAHRASRTCRQATERRLLRKRSADQALFAGVTFFVNGRPLENVDSFNYLGRPLEATDLDRAALTNNLMKARRVWGRISSVLKGGDPRPKLMARFYLAVVHSILLYGCETWVLSKRDERRLESFHNRCARHLAHMHIRCLNNGEWIHPPTSQVLERCGLSPISTYIAKRKTRLLHYAQASAVYQACLRSPSLGNSGRSRLMWWTTS
jgi:hypothetical protein